MNIFYIEDEPTEIAKSHVDRHVVKMPVECAQMLSTVLRTQLNIDYGYKAVYVNHPCTKWTGESLENFKFLLKLGIALCDEYEHRYGKEHATKKVLNGMLNYRNEISMGLPNSGFSEPPKCVSEQWKSLNTKEAYRQYYIHVKKRLHNWTNREKPAWIPESE
jgi:hypothetical protein